jgi:hypothetical protein
LQLSVDDKRKLEKTNAKSLAHIRCGCGALAFSTSNSSAQDPELDYEFFKSRVQPIFLTKRPDHARCYVCHVESNNAFHLETLSPNAREWTEEQSRRNFETVSRLVNPGDPDTSRLLLHPLALRVAATYFIPADGNFCQNATRPGGPSPTGSMGRRSVRRRSSDALQRFHDVQRIYALGHFANWNYCDKLH